MKKRNPQPQTATPLSVSVSVNDFRFVRELVEKLAWHPSQQYKRPEWVTPDCQSIESSSIEAFVIGKFNLSSPTEEITMSFTSSFFFTCTREEGTKNRLTWCHSLN